MYRVYVDDNLLYEPGIEELQIIDTELTREVNTTGIFNFTMYKNNICYDLIRKMRSIIEVFDGDKLIYRGRVLNDKIGLYNDRKIECEGELAYLNDSIFRPFQYEGSITGLLTNIINSHNMQVDEYKQFVLGHVTVTDPNNYINRSSIEAASSWETVSDKLIGLLGGYIMVRRVNDINYIDYLVDSNRETTQTIELGKNMLDFSRESRGESLITALIPYGANLKDEDGEETDIRLDITNVNNGLDYIVNNRAVDLHGLIFGAKTWDNVTTPEYLKQAAERYLEENIVFNNSTVLKAVDLNMLDTDFQKLQFFDYVTVRTRQHDFESRELIRKQTLDLINPQNNFIEIEGKNTSLTEQKHQSDKLIESIKADYVPNRKLNTIKERVTKVESEIVQLPDKIGLIVSEKTYTKNETDEKLGDLEINLQADIEIVSDKISLNVSKTEALDGRVSEAESNLILTDNKIQTEINERIEDGDNLRSELSSAVSQLSDSFTLEFSRIDGSIDAVGTDLEELKAYYRFTVDGAIIGKSNSPFQLTINNEEIQFLENGSAIAYINGRKMYIESLEILQSIIIGYHQVEKYDGAHKGTLVRMIGG